METATYNAQNANSIEAAYIRDQKSIYALTHAYRGFEQGARASRTPFAAVVIADRRGDTVARQEEIQARMGDLYYDLLDVDPARAHKLPEIPMTVAELDARRADERAR